MSFADPVGDMITRIRNAQLRALDNVKIPSSNFRAKILDVLKQEGYISNYKLLPDSKNKGSLLVDLKYNNGLPVIKEIKRISKPGRRIYTKADSIPKIQSGLGIAIVSTSMGIMSDNEGKFTLNVSQVDCNGVLNGTAMSDDCNICDETPEFYADCFGEGCEIMDCNGICPGVEGYDGAQFDDCENCGGDCVDNGSGFISCTDNPNNI